MLQVRQSWFGDQPPTNWKPANTSIGVGDDGVVDIIIDLLNPDKANDYTIEVVEGADADVDMEATLTGKAIEVTLGTDGAGDLDATQNTAELIAAEISTLPNISATFSGDGSGVFAATIAQKDFTDTQLGTECPEPFVVLKFWNVGNNDWDYYVNIAPNGRYDANWRVFNLIDY